jgi:hypothetical protein
MAPRSQVAERSPPAQAPCWIAPFCVPAIIASTAYPEPRRTTLESAWFLCPGNIDTYRETMVCAMPPGPRSDGDRTI